MPAERKCSRLLLGKQPLTLALIQTRYSPISNIAKYIPEIQDDLRRHGFPFMRSKQVGRLDITPEGPKMNTFDLWIFESADRYTSAIIDGSQTLLQTTKYDTFELFIEKYLTVLDIAMRVTEHSSYGMPVRLGLRYVDQVVPQTEDDDVDSYLASELRGMKTSFFTNTKKNYSFLTAGTTTIGNNLEGTLSIRILRNPGPIDLPQDLMEESPPRQNEIDTSRDFALIDMDHGCEGPFGPGINIQELSTVFYTMHDTIHEVFFNDLVTKEGIKKWS